VSEAAKIVGYASAPHFAKIFREKFGVLPTQILKQKKFYT
jgi:transcriptional regulator, araC family